MAVFQPTLPGVLQRYELKYVVAEELVEPITHFVAPYCDLDQHSRLAADHFYTVNSLYFDTWSCEFLKQRMWGRDNRINMRVRNYGDGTQPPYHLEIKNKRGAGMCKYRATVQAAQWPAILQDSSFRVSKGLPELEQQNQELFLRLATTYAIEPKILTTYGRRAFVSTVDDYARLTIDRNLRYREEGRFELSTLDRPMKSYDNDNIFVGNHLSEGSCVVLELKCVMGQVPIWMLDLIRCFALKQQGFSKYMSSMLVARRDDAIGYMPSDRSSQLAWA